MYFVKIIYNDIMYNFMKNYKIFLIEVYIEVYIEIIYRMGVSF